MQKSQETQVRSLGREDRGGGHGSQRQYSCLENPNDRRTGWAAVHGVEKSDTTDATNTHRATVGHLSCSGVGESLLASRGGGSGMLPSLPQRTRRPSSQALLYVDLLRTTSVSSSPHPYEVEHLSPFLRQEKEGSERFSHLPKITQQL